MALFARPSAHYITIDIWSKKDINDQCSDSDVISGYSCRIVMSTSFDSVLSEFVRRTCCEPAFARDLLQNVDWDVDAALAAYSKLSSNGTRAPQSTSSDNEESRSQQKIVGAGSSVPAAARGGRKSHHRGLSFCNSPVVTRLRNAVQYDMMVSEGSYKFSDYSFVLPDFSREDADYQEFLRKDLVNTAAQVALENAGMFEVVRLWSFSISGVVWK